MEDTLLAQLQQELKKNVITHSQDTIRKSTFNPYGCRFSYRITRRILRNNFGGRLTELLCAFPEFAECYHAILNVTKNSTEPLRDGPKTFEEN